MVQLWKRNVWGHEDWSSPCFQNFFILQKFRIHSFGNGYWISVAQTCGGQRGLEGLFVLTILSNISLQHRYVTWSKNRGGKICSYVSGAPRLLRPPRPGPYLKSGLQLTLSQPGGADYAHHNTMGLVWLKFDVAPLCIVSIQEQVMMARMQ